jgi:cell division ATPase FtsA
MKIKINPIEDIDKVLETAKIVFKPTEEEILKYHKKEVWLNKINSMKLTRTKVRGLFSTVCFGH